MSSGLRWPSSQTKGHLLLIEIISADGLIVLPLVIYPRKCIMENWVHINLEGGELITTSESGYTSKDVALAWLNHLV